MADSKVLIKIGADVSEIGTAAAGVKQHFDGMKAAGADLKAAFENAMSMKETGVNAKAASAAIGELATKSQTLVKEVAEIAGNVQRGAESFSSLAEKVAGSARSFTAFAEKAANSHGPLSGIARAGAAGGQALAGVAEKAAKSAHGLAGIAGKAASGATALAGMIPGWGMVLQGAVGAAGAIWDFGRSMAESQGKGSALNKAFEQSDAAMKSLKGVMTDALAPAMTKIVEWVGKLVAGFVESCKEGGFVHTLFDGLAAVFGVVGQVVGMLMGWIGKLIGGLIDGYKHSGAMKTVMDGLGVAFNIVREIIAAFVGSIIIRFQMVRAAIDLFVGGFRTAFTFVKTEIQVVLDYFKMLGTVIKDVLTLNWGAIAGDIRNGLSQIKKDVVDGAKSMIGEVGGAVGKARDRIAQGVETSNKVRNIIVETKLKPAKAKPAKEGGGKGKADDDQGGQGDGQGGGQNGGQNGGGRAGGTSHGGGGRKRSAETEDNLREERQIALKHLKWRAEDEAEAQAERDQAAKAAFDQRIAENLKLVETGKLAGKEETEVLKALYEEQAALSEKNAKADLAAQEAILLEKRRLYNGDKNAIEDIDREIQKLKKAHEVELSRINLEGIRAREEALKRAAEVEKKLAQERIDRAKEQEAAAKQQQANAEAAVGPWVDAVSQGVQGMIKGTETLQGMLQKIGQQILNDTIKVIEKRVKSFIAGELLQTATAGAEAAKRKGVEAGAEAVTITGWRGLLARWLGVETGKTAATGAGAQQRAAAEQGGLLSMMGKWVSGVRAWLFGEQAKTAATATGVAVRTTAEEAGSLKSLALSAATTLKRIAHEAAGAAAATYHAIASIVPFGPILAPAAAAAALGAVMAFGKSIFSAEGGWGQVPYDGALTELHKDEMVLPASIARPLRDSLILTAANTNAPSAANDAGGPAGDQFHLHIHAMDGASVERVLMGNSGAVRKAMEREYRALRVKPK